MVGFFIAWSRAEGRNEFDDVELLVRALQFTKDELLDCVTVLAPLGYRETCDVLRRLARRKRCH